jgi:hypothetical protein
VEKFLSFELHSCAQTICPRKGKGVGGDEIGCLAKAKQLEAVVECVDQWDLIPLPE